MTAIAGRESGWKNDAPHMDNNGHYATGLWQINPSTAADSPPLKNAQDMMQKLGGQDMGGLAAWALAPPGSVALNGIKQPDPYPWGTVPPVAANDSGYYSNGTFVPFNYSLNPTLIAQAIGAYAQLEAFGPATSAELNSANGWGAPGPSSTASSVDPTGPASDLSTAGTTKGCDKTSYLINGPLGINLIDKCQAKALKGGFLVAAGAGTMLLGMAMIIVSGLAGKGPLSPVVDIAGGYLAGARKLPGMRSSPSPSTPEASGAGQMRSDRATLNREISKRSTSSEDQSVNYFGGKAVKPAPASKRVDDSTEF
jgi:hypothetical protein